MSILIFLAVLFVLILVHEFGHFITAKIARMRVDEFGIGFPPRLFGKLVGETEYTLNALPIGGFVRIYGEDPASVEHDEHRGRSFTAKSRPAQAIVLLAGVTMNVIFAWLLLIVIFMMGMPSVVSEEAAGPEAELIVTEVLPDGPAADVLRPGTEILAIGSGAADGTLTPTAFSDAVKTSGGQTLTFTIQEGQDVRQVEITPEPGVISGTPERPAVGVAVALVETTQASFGGALVQATLTTGAMLRDITIGIYRLITDAFRGAADFSQVAGPVGIVGLVGDAAEFGLTSLLLFTAVISLNLAIINLLPFPALDGGRLVIVGIEALSRRTIDPVWVSRLNTIGFILLMLLMVAVTYNDISRIL